MPNWFNEQKKIFAFLRENVETEMTVKGGITPSILFTLFIYIQRALL